MQQPLEAGKGKKMALLKSLPEGTLFYRQPIVAQ